MSIVSKSANSCALSVKLQVSEGGVLRRLRSHNSNGRLLRILQMVADLFRKGSKLPQNGRFRFFRSIGTHRPDRGLVSFGHVRVGIPEPFNRSRGLNERSRYFTFK